MGDAKSGGGLDGLSLIVFSGDYERVHYALALAATAAATGRRATLFFTGEAVRALVAEDAGEGFGWRALPARGARSSERTGGRTGGEVDDDYVARGVAGFAELLAACGELEVRLIVCEMGLRVAGIHRDALRDDLTIEAAGIATLLADASPAGAMTFI